jgi:hypothetical protein
MDDLSSMGLCYKWDCVVECGMCWKKNVWEYICDNMYIMWIYAFVLWEPCSC